MPTSSLRSSDRVHVVIPIRGIGADAEGNPFDAAGRTVAISRKGAAVILSHRLTAQQEITIRRLDKGQEARACVLNRLGGQPPEVIYGIAFLNPEDNLWGVDFPQLSGGEEPLARLLLRCEVCSALTVVHLDEIELQVFELSHEIARFCKACSATTCWRQASGEQASRRPSYSDDPALPEMVPPVKPKDLRRHSRVRTSLPACVRQAGMADEIVVCENLSRGGLCFRSSRRFAEGSEIEVALSYTPGSANIFVPGRVAHVSEANGAFRCGVAYVAALEKRRGYDGSPCLVTKNL